MVQAAAAQAREDRRVPLSMSHIGIYVHELPKMEDFYTRVLGFTVTDRGKVRGMDIVFTSWDAKDHHQVILVAGRPRELALQPHQPDVVSRRFGRGPANSLARREGRAGRYRHARYGPWQRVVVLFPRPEGNRLEIFCDTQWYIEQPCIEDLDLSMPADEIRAKSDAFCRSAKGFRPIAEYQAEVAKKIARRQ